MHANFFAENDISDFLTLPEHDFAIVGDTLTSVTINYKWRVFIVAQIERHFEIALSLAPDSEIDTLENQYLNLIADFYN